VNTKKLHRPIYGDFIQDVRKGFLLLEENSGEEVKTFIKSQQHTSGAFVNRGGNPDLYYSLFGAWLSKALNLKDLQNNLREYTGELYVANNQAIDKHALLLIRLALNENDFSKPTLFSFLKTFIYSGWKMNMAYRAFLFLLSFDAIYKKQKFIYFILKFVLRKYRVSEDVPCSFRAALLLARHIVGADVEEDVRQLFKYYEEGMGFKAFKDAESADLLSTAVALFVLKKAGTELQVVAPDALELVQQNYDSGAFLAGNGDEVKDLEYTFYGLLILGTLS